jgi:hypothetical protein
MRQAGERQIVDFVKLLRFHDGTGRIYNYGLVPAIFQQSLGSVSIGFGFDYPEIFAEPVRIFNALFIRM